MIENITFKQCKINSVIFQNDTPINISNNGSEIGSLNVDSLGDNPTKTFISLIGDFKNSDINLISNCTINCEQGFSSNKPIKVLSKSPISVILSGNFSNSEGLIISGPCLLSTSSIATFEENFNISLSIEKDILDRNVSISGDFSKCTLNVNNSCNLNLGGSVQSLNIVPGINFLSLSLEVGTTISSANISSLVTVSGDQNSITNLKNNTIIGENNISISSISQIVLTNDTGIANTSLNINEPGQYKIIASISLPDEELQLGDALIINIP